MCGIVGYSGINNFNEDKIKTLMFFNQERGKDSLGYYTTKGINKELGKVEDVFTTKEYKIPEDKLFIGHVRAATVGKVELKNAHPFQHDNIVLVMNGTLTNHWSLAREYDFNIQDFDVDSDVLAAIINKTQSKEILSKIIGGCAIIYTNTNTGLMYAYRNAERPLYRGKLDDAMYLSSIDKSLKFIGCTDVKELKQDVLYEIKDGKVVNNFKIKKLNSTSTQSINTKDNISCFNHKLIKESNVTIYETNGIGFTSIDINNSSNKDLVGLWLTPLININDYRGVFLKGYGYLIEGFSKENNYDVLVRDNRGVIKNVTKNIFDNKVPKIDKDSYVFSTTMLTYSKSNNKICEENDLFVINKIIKNGEEFDCTNLINNKSCTALCSLFRPAYPLEVDEYQSIYGVPYGVTYENTDQNIDSNSKNEENIRNSMINFIKTVNSEEFKSNDELVNYTIDNIDDIADDILDITNDTKVMALLSKISIIVNNYYIKKGKIENNLIES